MNWTHWLNSIATCIFEEEKKNKTLNTLNIAAWHEIVSAFCERVHEHLYSLVYLKNQFFPMQFLGEIIRMHIVSFTPPQNVVSVGKNVNKSLTLSVVNYWLQFVSRFCFFPSFSVMHFMYCFYFKSNVTYKISEVRNKKNKQNKKKMLKLIEFLFMLKTKLEENVTIWWRSSRSQ